jgi:DNA-binding transcriptional MocR family regulator
MHRTPQDKRPCPHLRLTFAFLEEKELEEGVARLAAALKEVLGR